ncbi:MAG: hypothetical protein VB092_01400 [Oscillospiraceae bacterium]|nr:hypothetical protein [Oscillospiraceae bacterium]
MKIVKKTVARLQTPYAVDYFERKDSTDAVCASGDNDGCVMFDVATCQVREQSWSCPNGGAQVFHQLDENTFFCIQGFFPEYKCEQARLVRGRRTSADAWKIETCFRLPYMHKFVVAEDGDDRYLFAATLCGKKNGKEDWSSPGAVLCSKIPDDPIHGPWEFETVIPQLTKNHGFCKALYRGESTLFFSGSEGAFAVKAHRENNRWRVEQLLDHEVSDLYVCDLDDDGEEEITTINGFHGNTLAVYKHGASGYKEIFNYTLNYGHTVWAGRLQGQPAIITGELFGEERFIILTATGSQKFSEVYVGNGVGPFGVKVHEAGAKTYLLVPARAAEAVLL